MASEFHSVFILIVLFFVAITNGSMDYFQPGESERDDDKASLTDDEISYALSELSVDDLHTLSQVMDAMLTGKDDFFVDNTNDAYSPDELARAKRENPEEQDNAVPNVDDEYIKQLGESFPNEAEQTNQNGKDNTHVRVKRF